MKTARILLILVGVAAVVAVTVAAQSLSSSGPASRIESLCGSQIC